MSSRLNDGMESAFKNAVSEIERLQRYAFDIVRNNSSYGDKYKHRRIIKEQTANIIRILDTLKNNYREDV